MRNASLQGRIFNVRNMFVILILFQYHDTLTDALSILDKDDLTESPLILLHAGTHQSDNLLIDYNATILGAGIQLNFCYSIVLPSLPL